MADIRVERKRGGHTWLWILAAVVVLLAAIVLLDRAGYIDLPALGSALPGAADDTLLAHAAAVHMQEG